MLALHLSSQTCLLRNMAANTKGSWQEARDQLLGPSQSAIQIVPFIGGLDINGTIRYRSPSAPSKVSLGKGTRVTRGGDPDGS